MKENDDNRNVKRSAAGAHAKEHKRVRWAMLCVFIMSLVLAIALLKSVVSKGYKAKLQDERYASELLQVARTMLKEHATSTDTPIFPSPKSWPPSIQELKPSWVGVSPERVHIEMGGGLYHHGIDCFPDGVQGEGDTKIIDGLWYVSE